MSFGDAPNSMVADKLVEVRLRDGSAPHLLHVEVQAQRDASLAERVFDYNYHIRKQYGSPVTSLVLLADEDPNWRPAAFHDHALGTVIGISYTVAKLRDYAGQEDALLASDNPVAWVVLVHLRTQQTHHDPDRRYAAKWHLTRLLYQHGWRKRRILVLFNVINWMMTLPETYQKRYWRAVLQLERGHKMKLYNQLEQMFIDEGLQKGWQKGLQEGRELGRKDGAVALLERLLVRRFGPLPGTVQRKLARASAEQLQAWGEALLEAQSLKQVFAETPKRT